MGQTVTAQQTILYALAGEVHVGPKRIRALLAQYGDPDSIWEAPPDEVAATARLDQEGFERLLTARLMTEAISEDLELLAQSGTRTLSLVDEDYPERLFRLSDPPTVLFIRGTLIGRAHV